MKTPPPAEVAPAAGRPEPAADCDLCPRLEAYRSALRRAEPGWFNAPVPAFGDGAARFLIVGLAPGMRGANRTGRPFTGDYAGAVLYPALLRHGLARGGFAARTDDGLELLDTRIANAVRCVPPQNKPTGAEIVTCRRFLLPELSGAAAPQVILALGRIAHESVLRALGLRVAAWPFAHRGAHALPHGQILVSSYHTSRYNVNTGRLTLAMFEAVMRTVAALLGGASLSAAQRLGDEPVEAFEKGVPDGIGLEEDLVPGAVEP
jgi:uracil-DNA glycosylase family 4